MSRKILGLALVYVRSDSSALNELGISRYLVAQKTENHPEPKGEGGFLLT
ncbi:hypothetical protein [Vibrio breoganii]|nr:hypothetical protein [Vibrio breoganii]